MNARLRGVYEKQPGSGEWWVRYNDSDGRLRRELAGTWASARDLYKKRKFEALCNKKLPEKLRARVVPFSELCDDSAAYTKAHNEGFESDCYRIEKLKQAFGSRPAESITITDFRKWFDAQGWKGGTANRVRTVLYSIFRLGVENRKVKTNTAKLLKRAKVKDDRVRYLDQFEPLPTQIDYLVPLKTESGRLRAVIEHDFPEHLDEFIVALNTGIRNKEQYTRCTWECVDFARKSLYVPPSKNGDSRHVPLNAEALAAFERLRQRAIGAAGVIPMSLTGPIFTGRAREALQSARHWFEDCVAKAGVRDFTWHCLRHTFASRLAMQNEPILTIAKLLGHRSLAMTQRYAHLSEAHQRSAVERLSAFNG